MAATLRLSSTETSTSAAQRATEVALFEAAAHGEAHLHVSSLRGELLSLGAFHREPRGADELFLWRRLWGGRAMAAGTGFRVLTLALPHRSALVSPERSTLRPEQSLNRCVRGLRAALERIGAQPIYPGLDQLTVRRRTIAQLGLAEQAGGATLFQAVIAWSESFACTSERLDRVDPEGRVPMALTAADSFARVIDVASDAERRAGSVAAFAELAADGYRAAFQIEVVRGQPPASTGATNATATRPVVGVEPPSGAGTATIAGRIGPITAWLVQDAGRIAGAGISGDFLAPLTLPAELGGRLSGLAADRATIAAALDGWLDGSDRYLLGLRTLELADVLATAALRSGAIPEARP